MTIRMKLVGCIALMIATIVGISAFSFHALRQESALAGTIVADRVIPLEQLKTISDRYAVNIVDTAHKVRAGTLTPAEGLASVDQALGDIEAEWTAYMATYLTPEEAALAENFGKQRTRADAGVAELRRILEAGDLEAIARFAETDLYPTIDPLGEDIAKLIDLQIRVAKENLEAGNALKDQMFVIMATLCAVAVTVAAFSVWTVTRGVVRPLDALSDAMGTLAGGNNEVDIFGEGRRDEIGRMAASVAVFRDNARERVKLEREAAENRDEQERQRQERERVQAADAEEIRFAVESLGNALGELAAGRLTVRINDVFTARLDKVRQDFNAAVTKLDDAMRAVGENAQVIAAGSGQIRAAADNLANRTAQQAASVEETAAALEQITSTGADSSRRADEAGKLVNVARDTATRSGAIVGRTVEAMQAIEASSRAISNIIGVIDDIAFQTNLLALNAGVEAARAGESGKGFAVVAQEVRELAQRSAKAAKEIKALIGKSGEQVRDGVSLVSETGKVLDAIVEQVMDVRSNVVAIVEAAREQSMGLKEINTAVNSMDQNVQQNAAMVEESTAASHSLAREAEALFTLIGRFEVGGKAPAPAVNAPSNTRSARSLKAANAPTRTTVAATHGNAAVAEPAWENF
ncbi:HAMP domain-containing methyl-accepting chemotaxis protein [Ciceribacter sp. L1K23]|uniref:HAMP domain-containing methyl-accepting chemotaxis protein n=1 Tax=Ciceribacter sp. L1K23 TaxID=2820276 RepID=UPI0024AE9820|nr:HAMP domain-containing methyl-accepting chemotaxis protein [Ciceribacter sp. L1K23]